jgi:exodeoxyribonuclease VII small subunit
VKLHSNLISFVPVLGARSGQQGRQMAKEKFEDALGKLEKIVSKLEEGDLPLEESLKYFEEGIRLSRFCNQKLDEAEKRVEILLKDKEGNLHPEPFVPSTGSGQGASMDSEPPLFSGRQETPRGAPGEE